MAGRSERAMRDRNVSRVPFHRSERRSRQKPGGSRVRAKELRRHLRCSVCVKGRLSGAFSGATLGTQLGERLIVAGLSPAVANPLGFAIVITLITYLSLVIGELVPKQLALKHAERIACFVAPVMVVLAKLASPLVW